MPYGGNRSAQGYFPFKSLSVVNVAQQVQSAYPSAQRGNIGGGLLQNTSGATRYVKLYDKATQPVVGTDVPKWTLVVAAGGNLPLMNLAPLFFNLGIWVAATTGIADNDVGAPAANDVVVNLEYT